MSAGFAVTVRLDVIETDLSAFLRAIRANAAQSVAAEPGCRRFDVLIPEQAPAGRVLLYEIYTDRAAFEQHLRSDHFRDFDAATRSMVRSKVVDVFSVTEHPKP